MAKKKEIEIEILKGFIEETETEIADKELVIEDLQIDINRYKSRIIELELDKSN